MLEARSKRAGSLTSCQLWFEYCGERRFLWPRCHYTTRLLISRRINPWGSYAMDTRPRVRGVLSQTTLLYVALPLPLYARVAGYSTAAVCGTSP